jgi:starvation-inducible DNA-binding protein
VSAHCARSADRMIQLVGEIDITRSKTFSSSAVSVAGLGPEIPNALLADAFTPFLKAKNFHWHVSGPYFRDYHLLFEEQAADPHYVRRLRSIGDIARHQRLKDNGAPYVSRLDMLGYVRITIALLHRCGRPTMSVTSTATWQAPG